MKSNIIFINIWVLIALSSFSFRAISQTVTLEQCIDIARKNNKQLKQEQLVADYHKTLTNSFKNIDKTTFGAEFGQINSAFFDTRINIAQSISHPKVFKTEKNVLTEEWKSAVLKVGLKEYEIKKSLSFAFYNYLFWKEKIKLLQKADTLFSNFYEKSVLRLQKGESTILEKTTAENLRATIRLQLKQAETEQKVSLLELQLMMNTVENIVPVGNLSKEITIYDSSFLQQNPYLQILRQQQEITKAMTEAEKSKLLPNFSAGYSNISFRGIGPDNVNYNWANRFHGFQLGVGVPIFSKAQKVRIEASKMAENIAEHQVSTSNQLLQSKNNQLISKINAAKEMVDYYEREGLLNAQTITSTANRQFAVGEINYLDWVLLVRQSLSIEEEHLNSIKSLNDTALELKYLTLNP